MKGISDETQMAVKHMKRCLTSLSQGSSNNDCNKIPFFTHQIGKNEQV